MNLTPADTAPASPGMIAAAEGAIALDPLAQQARDQEKQHVTKLFKAIDQALAHDSNARKGYQDDRRYARGETEWLVDTNLVQTIIEILMAFVYAKDPDISVAVADSVGDSRAALYAPMVETLQIVVSRLLKKAGMKKAAKKLVRQAMTVGIGWLSVGLQTRTPKDSQVQTQINDLKQQIDNCTALQSKMAEDSTDYCEQATLLAQYNANMTALQEKMERAISYGLVLEVLDPNDVIVSPECGMLEDYLRAPWITKRFYKTELQIRALTKWDEKTEGNPLKSAARYCQRPRGDAKDGTTMEWVKIGDDKAESVDGFFLLEEMWHLDDGVIYTLIDGVKDRYAIAPFAPRQSSRFYDVFQLAFHHIDGDRHPQSDVKLMKRLQDEYGRARSNWAEHRKRSIPGTIVDAAQVNETEMRKLTEGTVSEFTAINFNGTDDIRKVFANKQYPQVDPALYDTDPILRDIEKVSGAQEALQSSIGVEKTATEAEIQSNGFGARIGTRKDATEELITDVAIHVSEISLQVVPEDFVLRLAGPQAVWPALSIDDIMYGFDIEVRGGSTGKPNFAAQQKAWATMLPLIEKMITVIGNFRAAGQEWAAQPYIALLKETSRRMGEKIDINQFLPQAPTLPPQVDPATGAVTPAAPMAPAMSAPGGANNETPPPQAAPPDVP